MLLKEFGVTLRMWRKKQDHQDCRVPIQFPVMTEAVQSAGSLEADFSAAFAVAGQADCF